jgi:hypothetical protein
MRASPFTQVRRALLTGVFLLASGALWACNGESATDPSLLQGGAASVAGDTIPGDTTPGDTIPGDTLPGDTIPGDTVPPDTIPGDTVPPDTVPGDTTSTPGGGQRTSQLTVQVGVQVDSAALMPLSGAVVAVSRGGSPNVVARDTTSLSGLATLQLSPGRYTVTLERIPGPFELAPGEPAEQEVVLTPNTATGIRFRLVRQ